jgi:hypothetical protein
MEGLPRAPVLFSLRRIDAEGSPDSAVASTIVNAAELDSVELDSVERQKMPSAVSVLPSETAGSRSEVLKSVRRRRVPGITARKGLFPWSGRRALTASLLVLIAAGGIVLGRQMLQKFSMKHEIVVVDPQMDLKPFVETVLPELAPRKVLVSPLPLSKGVTPSRDLTPAEFAEQPALQDEEDGPILKLSGRQTPELYRRVRRASHVVDSRVSSPIAAQSTAPQLTAPQLEGIERAAGSELSSRHSDEVKVEVESINPVVPSIHVIPRPSHR